MTILSLIVIKIFIQLVINKINFDLINITFILSDDKPVILQDTTEMHDKQGSPQQSQSGSREKVVVEPSLPNMNGMKRVFRKLKKKKLCYIICLQ